MACGHMGEGVWRRVNYLCNYLGRSKWRSSRCPSSGQACAGAWSWRRPSHRTRCPRDHGGGAHCPGSCCDWPHPRGIPCHWSLVHCVWAPVSPSRCSRGDSCSSGGWGRGASPWPGALVTSQLRAGHPGPPGETGTPARCIWAPRGNWEAVSALFTLVAAYCIHCERWTTCDVVSSGWPSQSVAFITSSSQWDDTNCQSHHQP